jgi:hypothetical protein
MTRVKSAHTKFSLRLVIYFKQRNIKGQKLRKVIHLGGDAHRFPPDQRMSWVRDHLPGLLPELEGWGGWNENESPGVFLRG